MDALVAWLWQFAPFRYLVLLGVQHLPSPASDFLATHTPVLFALRDLMLEQGDFDLAAGFSREIRRLGLA